MRHLQKAAAAVGAAEVRQPGMTTGDLKDSRRSAHYAVTAPKVGLRRNSEAGFKPASNPPPKPLSQYQMSRMQQVRQVKRTVHLVFRGGIMSDESEA